MTSKTHLIYFSPTKTTQKIVEQIAAGIGSEQIEHYNLTLADGGMDLQLTDGVAVIGIPVYAGRVPEVCLERMQGLTATGVPAVLVALYGNREYEDALVELRDVASTAGFSILGAGAFIGEHSYSTAEQPIAANRPDAGDLLQAKDFGAAVAAKLQAGQTTDPPKIPGDVPYKERVPLGGVAPETDRRLCTLCGTCARVCPTFVIEVTAEVVTEADNCVMCCACVKYCPERVRRMNHPRVQSRRDLLAQNCQARKEPAVFL